MSGTSGLARFREQRSRDAWLMLDPEFEAALEAAGLLRAERLLGLLQAHAHEPAPGASRGRAATALLELPGRGERLHLRRTLHGGLLAGLWRGRLAGPGRVRAEMLVTAALRDRGAAVPRPVLAFGRRSGPLWRAAIATLHEEHSLDGAGFLSAHPTPARVARAAAAAGRAIRHFHDLGGRHRDLHVKNILIRERPHALPVGADAEAILIDLDRARIGAPTSRGRRGRELARLERSLRKHELLQELDEAGRAAFLSAYHSDYG